MTDAQLLLCNQVAQQMSCRKVSCFISLIHVNYDAFLPKLAFQTTKVMKTLFYRHLDTFEKDSPRVIICLPVIKPICLMSYFT